MTEEEYLEYVIGIGKEQGCNTCNLNYSKYEESGVIRCCEDNEPMCPIWWKRNSDKKLTEMEDLKCWQPIE